MTFEAYNIGGIFMDRQLSLEFVRVTEQAAIKSGRLMGCGDKEGADQLAVDGMHEAFSKTAVSGTVVIGEGELDEAPMLYIGEHVGAGGEAIDIAVDPVEGTNLVAKGKDGAIAVMAVAPAGSLLHAPDMYMYKICVGPRAKGRINIDAPVAVNLKNVAEAMNREIADLTVVTLDRERHAGIIRECREAGARIRLITDGDVAPAVECGIQGSGIHMVIGQGGAPEGVLAAVGLKCLGGDMQARLLPHNEEEINRMRAMGIEDPSRVFTIDDLVKGDDCIFSATAITDCNFLKGVRYFDNGCRTSTMLLRYKTGTVRFIDTVHRFGENKPIVKL
jgi:fructose-1,6-bisphosphatase, class II